MDKTKYIYIFFLSVAALLFTAQSVSAGVGVGAKPQALGGAFVSLADDANAIYWNPAALGLMERAQITYSGMIYDRDETKYDDWGGFTYPVKVRGTVFDWGVIGIAAANNVDKGTVNYPDFTASAKAKDAWLGVAYGRKFAEGLGLGISVWYKEIDVEIAKASTWQGRSLRVGNNDSDNAWQFDLAAYYKISNFSFGLLVQNINEPEYKLFNGKIAYGIDYNVGACYRPDEKTTITAELHDVGDENVVKAGVERWINDVFAIRLGIHDPNSDAEYERAITGGLGINVPEKYSIIPLELNYTLMYWYDASGDYGDFTNLAGLTIKF